MTTFVNKRALVTGGTGSRMGFEAMR